MNAKPGPWGSVTTKSTLYESKRGIILGYDLPVENIFAGEESYHPLRGLYEEGEVLLNQQGIQGARLVEIVKYQRTGLFQGEWVRREPTLEEREQYEAGRVSTDEKEHVDLHDCFAVNFPLGRVYADDGSPKGGCPVWLMSPLRT